MSTAETITYRGYAVEIHYDEDATNPLKEYDSQPVLVLHTRAEGKFGWTNNEDWGAKLNAALDGLNERHPLADCLDLIQRWLRVFHGVRVLLPVGAGDHSGWWAYLGTGASFGDPGGWDSGWVGWLFATGKQIEDWGYVDKSDEELEKAITASFEEFASYVSGEVFGFRINDPEGEYVDSCGWFYGPSYEEGGYMYREFTAIIDAELAARHESRVDLFKKLVLR